MMKKVFLAIFILNSFFVFGQSKIRFGIVATPQVSWLKSDVKSVETDGIKAGIVYGLNLEYAFSDNASITTGLVINNSGGKLKYSDTLSFTYGAGDSIASLPGGVSMMYKNQYIEIPIGLKFKTNEIGYLKYFAQLGLTPLITIGAKGESENTEAIDKIDNEKILEEVTFFTLGYHIGAGVEYNLSGNTSLLVGLIYTNGFTDVTKNPTSKKETNIKDKAILNSISLKIGVLF